MRKSIAVGIIFATFILLAVGAQAASQAISIRLLSENEETLTLGWTPVSGAIGYRFTRSDQAARPHTWDAARSTVRFGKAESVTYSVQALALLDSGEYPEPLPPPPPAVGTTLNIVGQWICNQPLSAYGSLPLTVNQTITQPASLLTNQPAAVRLNSGCTAGARDGVPDLILNINGDGNDVGSGRDGLALVGVHDMDITGYVNCGRVASGSHQDGVQMNWGFRLNFIDFESGDWANQTATCHGAAGIWNVTQSNQTDIPNRLQDVVCDGCRMVGSSPTGGVAGTAFNLGPSIRSGARNSCFAARRPFNSPGGAIDGINEGNLFIDTDSPNPQPSPSECP